MINFLFDLSPLILAIIGGVIAFIFSCLGSAIVLFFRKINKNIMDYMLAISAGVMLSAAFFSLLNPAIDLSYSLYKFPIIVVTLGFLIGGLIIFLLNKLLNNLFNSNKLKISKIFALFTSITLHNIPEGLVIGVAFGSLIYDNSISNLISAFSLTLGIALQNFPEGAALSLPIRNSGLSSKKSFIVSVFSALVEPIAAFIGAFIVFKIQMILPIILALAAGAMIYVTCMELIPECQYNKNNNLITMLICFGFSIMMFMEIILG